MNKLFLAVMALCLVMSSCRKGQIVKPTEPVKTVDQPKTGQSVDNPQPTNPTTFSTLDLNSIEFTPSTNRIPLNAFAFSCKNNTVPITMQLLGIGWTHPSVLHFPVKWNGYFYWMAITPYPNGDNQWENPTSFCSNDGINWREPDEKTAVINLPPTGGAYNSDPSLFYNAADNSIYCFWRQNGVEKGRALFFEKTSDGVNWSEKKLVCSWPAKSVDVIAPSIIQDEGKFYCYGVSTDEAAKGSYFTERAIRRMSSDNLTTGFKPDKANGYDLVKIANRPWGETQEPWHLEVRKVNKVWIMLVATTNNGLYGAGGRLFMGYSTDGLDFTFGERPIADIKATYKSSFIPTYDPKNQVLNVELWRAMSDTWTVYHDYFSIKVK